MVDVNDYSTHHILFDDNNISDQQSNLDVRDLSTNQTMKWKKHFNKYTCRVEPHKAITEHDYFIKHIERCEKARDEEIEKLEMGLEST